MVACLSVLVTGCTQTDFPENKAQNIMAANPIHLDAEQVMLTPAQVECGVKNELWDSPVSQNADETIARLMQAGRDLHFDDDVMVSQAGYTRPYVQVRGDFMMQLFDGLSVRSDGPQSRFVDGKLGVIIPQSCFSDPLPLMGVRKGKFAQDAPMTIHFKLLDDGWHFDKLIH